MFLEISRSLKDRGVLHMISKKANCFVIKVSASPDKLPQIMPGNIKCSKLQNGVMQLKNGKDIVGLAEFHLCGDFVALIYTQ
jgi:hypothetical protein